METIVRSDDTGAFAIGGIVLAIRHVA